MKTNARSGIEVLLAGIAVAAVASLAGCGGTRDGPGNSSGSGGSSGDGGSSGTRGNGGSSGTSGSTGPKTCENGKDPLCSCNLPGPQSVTGDVTGPPDAGDGGTGDGGTWRCEDECSTYRPNGNGTLESCSFAPAAEPQKVTCNYYVKCVGRRPAELEEPVLESTEARELLSATARLEEASIHAFTRLARELAHHRAPAALVAQARNAARDEVTHARAMRSLAARFGADDADDRRARSHVRRVPRLVDVLVENAVEGCVRETFGAVMAHVQARRASDPVVRLTMARIADDESRHAALAWAIDAWGCSRMRPAERRRIAAARQAAVRSLALEIESGPLEVDEPELGLVGAASARALVLSLERDLWCNNVPAAA